MEFYGLNTYKQKARFWREKYDSENVAFQQALADLPEMTAYVINMHYKQNKTLPEISLLIGKSISIVRNHHDLGIFKIYQYLEARKIIN